MAPFELVFVQPGPVDSYRQLLDNAVRRGLDESLVHIAHRNAEGLGGAGVFVLHPGNAHIPVGNPKDPGQPHLHIPGVQPLFGDVDVEVLALAGGFVEGNLLHNKMVRAGAQTAAHTGQITADKGQSQVKFQRVHR